MKRIILYLFVGVSSLTLKAQKNNLSEPLPSDKTIIKGVLGNGMTYYIKKTDVTKGVASYYIIQNVGSTLENDNQKGLAHFLEHMAFNGTKNFEGKGILNTMQKHGLSFGRDINAYTSFDETVYNINNIPNTNEMIDKGLLVLHDWSHYLLLTDKEIDAERGVIKEEWRTRQNGNMRMLEQTIGVLYNNSKYAYRLPIGTMDIVENFKYNAIRDFYHDWYRTDLQAIAIIGDVDPTVIENKIKALFSGIPAVKNPKKREVVEIAENDELLYGLGTDDEITTSSISFGIRHHRNLENQTTATLKQDLINAMAMNMLHKRLSEKSQDKTAPFLDAAVDYNIDARTTKNFNVYIQPKQNQQKEAFKVAMTEVYKAVKFGFTDSEISRTVAEFENSYQNKIISRDDATHEEIESVIQMNYLFNETMTDIEQEYDLVKSILSTLSSTEIQDGLKKLFTTKNRFLVVNGVKGENNLTKAEASGILYDIENDKNLQPYKDAFEGKSLIGDTVIKEGTIVSEKQNDEVGATEFTLSNGIKVYYKYANKNKNDVQLKAVSYGGNSLLADEDLPSSSALGAVMQYSGLGDYTAANLQKVMAGKTAQVSANIGALTENVNGSAVTKDVETMLQMVYLQFTKPRFDQDAYNVVMENFNNKVLSRSEDIQEKMEDSTVVTLYGLNNPKKRLFNKEYVEAITFDKIKSVYNARFGNAADFEFFLVGDIEKDKLKPLLEKYVAGINTTSAREQWKDNSVNWLKANTDKTMYLKMSDPKSSVSICFKKEFTYNLKNQMLASILADMLQLRYDETLREEEGGTYGASTYGGVVKRPVQEAVLFVKFDCNPEKTDKLISIVHKEINKMAAGDIDQKDLDKILTNYLKARKQDKDVNAYDLELLTNFYKEGYNMDKAENFENIVKSVTKKDIADFTSKLLKKARSYQIVFKPQL
ncbi:M16 family metallopeptidase [Flavobacterium pectinovorum]|uniref:M16 family metallopeptidase n=1 Tax=Flavobacterium pectinovorum TaxID=29533 RepID=UPI001FAE1085|nr:M16 family metallopeptidase [Flavobacterium pectinovorum]MCI9846849.1 insulinase family protein [Flavobacterium pectinovorum]